MATIGILGAGNVGGALGRVWAARGHRILFGKRGGSNAEAASASEVVVLSVPWGAAQEAIRSCGDWKGKILIDCTNPVDYTTGRVLPESGSAAELVARVAGICGEYDRRPATPAEARQILGLQAAP